MAGEFKKNASPKTRVGQTYPGGKSMRRALKALAARTKDALATRETISRRVSKSLPPEAYTMPGSMRG